MTYTFTEVETFNIDDDFDSLYTDSLDDLNGGTIVANGTAEEKKQRLIQLVNEQNIHNMKNIIIARDGKPCMYIQ